MINWVLILTVTVAGNGGPSIDHIADFQSKDACQIAGQRWKDAVGFPYTHQTFVCVELKSGGSP